MVEEGKLILDRILSVTPLEDLQLKAPLISKEDSVITYPDVSYPVFVPNKLLIICMTHDQLFHTYGQKCSQITRCHEYKR
jgi:hypothetical protein